MTERVFVKPAEGLKVRTEDGRRHVRAEGEHVSRSTYYRRRITAGDLVEAASTGPVQPSPGAAKKSKE